MINELQAKEDQKLQEYFEQILFEPNTNSLENVSKQMQDQDVQVQLQEKNSNEYQEKNEYDYAPGQSLQTLLENMPSIEEKTESAVAIKEPEIALDSKLELQEPKIELASVEQVKDKEPIVELAAKQELEVKEQLNTAQKELVDEKVASEIQEQTQGAQDLKNEDIWQNIQVPDEFQTLFFTVQGVRFAVPLIDLGGIFETEKITTLFGKPQWYMGITDIRGDKFNIVDTLRWVKPEIGLSPESYPYLIALSKSLWCLGCDVLEGNRTLRKEHVKWREKAGTRPWLAGIVKNEMCALLHVNELIKLFKKGVDHQDLQQ